jgi:ubiquinone/menaquinone biosynthesis C-methylase UbiE
MSNPNKNYRSDLSYYSRDRDWPLLFDIPPGSKVLDVGCGTGVLGKLLKDKLDCHVIGLEIAETSHQQALYVLDDVILGDVETMQFPDKKFSFDYVIFSDSLEHFLNPEIVLERVIGLLNPDGKLLIAMPNVRNFKVTFPLLFQDSWEYQDEGLLDRTHLRFFTGRSLTNLIKSKGMSVSNIFYHLPLNSKVGLLNLFTLGLFKKHLTSHYFVESCQIKY